MFRRLTRRAFCLRATVQSPAKTSATAAAGGKSEILRDRQAGRRAAERILKHAPDQFGARDAPAIA